MQECLGNIKKRCHASIDTMYSGDQKSKHVWILYGWKDGRFWNGPYFEWSVPQIPKMCTTDAKKKSQPFENPTKKPGFQMVKSKIASKKTQPFENWTKLSGIKRVRVKQPLKWNRVRRGGQVNPNFEWRHLRMIPYLVRRWSDIAVEEFFEKL